MGVICATYTVVDCCLIVIIDVESLGVEVWISVVFSEGLNSATVTAGKDGCDRLDEAVFDASMSLAFDGSSISVCVLKIGTVVASSSTPESANVGIGTLRWMLNVLSAMSRFWVDSGLDAVCVEAKACASSTIQDSVFPCGGSKVVVDCAATYRPGST